MTDRTPEMETRNVEGRIIDFLQDEVLSPGVTVHRDDELLSGQILDSMAVVRLAAFVEAEFQIGMQPSDFVIGNFRTVAVLAGYVRGAKSPSGAPTADPEG